MTELINFLFEENDKIIAIVQNLKIGKNAINRDDEE